MNKKKLSVVMAGAMLATSVAPVLAAPVEYGTSQKKLVEKEITDLVKSGKISADTTLKTNDFATDDVISLMDAAYSVYGLKVLDKDGKAIDLTSTGGKFTASNTVKGDNTLTYNIADIESILADTDLKENMTIQVVERENSKFLGEVIPGSEITGKGVSEKNKFKYEDLTDLSKFKTATGLNLDSTTGTSTTVSGDRYIKSVSLEKGVATITLNAVKDLTVAEPENIKIELKEGSSKLYFSLPINAKGNLVKSTDSVQDCVSFVEKETFNKSQITKEDPEVKAEYKLVDDSVKAEKVTYLASDLYDGLALKAKGTEIQLDLENAKKVAKENGRTAAQTTVKLAGVTDQGSDGITADDIVLNNKGVASFTVEYYNSYKEANDPTKVAKEVTVKSTNLKEIQSLYKMLTNGGYEVGIVAGANRYETAVNVAKAQGITEIAAGKAANPNQNDIVLVNGNSLVDGLSAAPLAASLKWNNQATGTAVLLSKTDSLPKETKDYLESLLVNVSSSKIRNVKIHLVGGESVLSESLVEELKEMGFSVERHGGDNREETSLEVAEAVETLAGAKKGAFVVGGNGEADAMSIAAVAASKKTPIIVSSVHGLTKDALKHVKGRANEDIKVIGGESVVSAEEYAKLDALTADNNAVVRISGKNRFETNAKIIEEEYSSNVKNVVLVKDGQSNKDELVDALSAASFAAKNNAPIVLATDKITDAQKTAILNKKDGSGFEKLTQVGQGVARTTLEAVAEFLGLSNVR